MIALGRAMQEKHHQMTFFLKLQETELEVMFRWDSIRSIRSRPNDNEVKSAYWPSAAVNPHQPSLRAFKVRSTNASLRSAAGMLMQRQALLSQVDGGMAMWHAVKRCISPSIPKFWPENLEFGAGPKITIIEETSQTNSTSDMFWLIDNIWFALSELSHLSEAASLRDFLNNWQLRSWKRSKSARSWHALTSLPRTCAMHNLSKRCLSILVVSSWQQASEWLLRKKQ